MACFDIHCSERVQESTVKTINCSHNISIKSPQEKSVGSTTREIYCVNTETSNCSTRKGIHSIVWTTNSLLLVTSLRHSIVVHYNTIYWIHYKAFNCSPLKDISSGSILLPSPNLLWESTPENFIHLMQCAKYPYKRAPFLESPNWNSRLQKIFNCESPQRRH